MTPENHNNILIYWNNLSIYYVACVIVSIIAIVFSWYFHFKNVPEDIKENQEAMNENEIDENCASEQFDDSEVEDMEGKLDTTNATDDELTDEFNERVPILKNKSKEALEKISSEMTEEQLKAEREAEQRQLSKILELLKKQEEKFQVTSMEELEGQLKLYR